MTSLQRLSGLFCILLILLGNSLYGQNLTGVVNSYAAVTNAPNFTPCNPPTLHVAYRAGSSAANFTPNTKVLVIQMKGANINTGVTSPSYGNINALNGAGVFEFAEVQTTGVSGGNQTITLKNRLYKEFDFANPSAAKIQIVALPTLPAGNVTVTGTLTAAPWDGSTGGVLVVDATDKDFILNADIDVSGLGFRGGIRPGDPFGYDPVNASVAEYEFVRLDNTKPADSLRGGGKGEGIADNFWPNRLGRGANANGGGGGNSRKSGGAGGGNYGVGGTGGHNQITTNDPILTKFGGRGGVALKDEMAKGRLFLGGGGGAGHIDSARYNLLYNLDNFANGFPGGGIVFIKAKNIDGPNFKIKANGLSVNRLSIGESGGGGGAGGTIFLDVTNANLSGVEAKGGDGGYVYADCFPNPVSGPPQYRMFGPGGGGSGGALLYSGTTLPPTDFTGGKPGFNFTNSPNLPAQFIVNDPLLTSVINYCHEPPYGYDPATSAPEVLNHGATKGADGGIVPVTDPNITQPPADFKVTHTQTNVSCRNGFDGFFTMVPESGGAAPFTYSFDNGVSFSPNNTREDLPAGNYTVIVRDQYGCEAVNAKTGAPYAITITQPDLLDLVSAEALPKQLCFDAKDGKIQVTSITGGTQPYKYELYRGSTLNAPYRESQSANAFENLPPYDSGDYIIRVTDANGCSDTYSIAITSFQNLPNAGTDVRVCIADPNNKATADKDITTPLELTSATTNPGVYLPGATWTAFRWNEATGTYDDATNDMILNTSTKSYFNYDNLPAPYVGKYLVYARVSETCYDSIFIEINTISLDQSDITVCIGLEEYPLPIADPTGGVWTGTGVKQNQSGEWVAVLKNIYDANPLGSSPYPGATLTYTNTFAPGYNCSKSFNFYVRPKPTAKFTSVPPILPNYGTVLNVPKESISFTDASTGNPVSFLWEFGDGQTSTEKNPPAYIYQDNDTVDVKLTVTDAQGCTDTTVQRGLVIEKYATLDVPNVFTPTKNGKNDFFELSGYNVKKISLKVYNRFGIEVFADEVENDLIQWDGSVNGKEPVADVYFYSIKMTRFDGKEINRTGTVTVIVGNQE